VVEPVKSAKRSALAGCCRRAIRWAARSMSTDPRPAPLTNTSWVVNARRVSSWSPFGVKELIPWQNVSALQLNISLICAGVRRVRSKPVVINMREFLYHDVGVRCSSRCEWNVDQLLKDLLFAVGEQFMISLA
jgi:hypothetical protein